MHLHRITYFFHWQRQNDVEMPGFEPGAFHMRSERSTTELHPRAYYIGIADPSKLPSALCPTFCSKNIEIQNEIKKALLRFELRISCLLDRRFNQLSHRAISASRWSINKYSWHSWPFLVHLSFHNATIYVQNESKNPTTTRLELAIFWSEVRRLIH